MRMVRMGRMATQEPRATKVIRATQDFQVNQDRRVRLGLLAGTPMGIVRAMEVRTIPYQRDAMCSIVKESMVSLAGTQMETGHATLGLRTQTGMEYATLTIAAGQRDQPGESRSYAPVQSPSFKPHTRPHVQQPTPILSMDT